MKNFRNLNTFTFIRTYRTSRKSYLRINYLLDEVIIGVLLGDASMNKPYTTSNVSLLFEQSIKNKIYIDHLYSLFEEYCGTQPRIRIISKSNKTYESVKFKTLCLPCFNYYWDLFYKFNGIKYKKVIPENLSSLLTPKALAYWFMDDGGKLTNKRGPYLHTESFSLEEQKLIIETLKAKFDLNCSIHKSVTNKNKIYISNNSVDKLIYIIKPYLLSHFYYKLGT